jgi:hypothetical protein
MTDIASFFDIENSVTVRWLSNVLDVNLAAAQRNLAEFKASQSQFSASYLLAGEDQQGGLLYIVAQEHELEESNKYYKTVRSKDLHALHQLRSESFKSEIQALELDQSGELLMMGHPSSASFFRNQNGFIRCPGIDVKPPGQRILSANYSVPPVAMPALAAKEVAKAATNKVSTEKAVAAAPAVLKSKTSIQASSFFAAAAVKTEKPTSAVAANKENSITTTLQVMPEPQVIVKAEDKAPKRVGKIAVEEDEDEWDSEYKPDPAKLQERIDAVAALSRRDIRVGATEDPLPAVEMETEESITVTATSGAKRKQKAPVVVHGAMDDFFEDVAIADHNRAVEAGGVAAPKPKKRKLVEKVSPRYSLACELCVVLLVAC